MPTIRVTQNASFMNPATIQYVTNDNIRVSKIEDRLKQWHAQMDGDSKTHFVPLTRFVCLFNPICTTILLFFSQRALPIFQRTIS